MTDVPAKVNPGGATQFSLKVVSSLDARRQVQLSGQDLKEKGLPAVIKGRPSGIIIAHG